VLNSGKPQETEAMKIDNNDPIMKGRPSQGAANSQPAGQQEFGKILKDTVENIQKADGEPRQTAFINPLASVWRPARNSADPEFAIDRIENMIDLLDQYRHKLADPEMNLKQIDPIINEIVRENDNLTSLADSLPAADGLKSILERTMVTASLEVTKFYRGDYLPA
jgi:hypothetical protein